MSGSSTSREAINASIELKLELMVDTVGVHFTPDELQILKEAYARSAIGKATVRPFDNPQRQVSREAMLSVAASEEGFCYLNFVRTLPSYESASKERFNESFTSFRTGLGKEPKGRDVIVNLCLMESVLCELHSPDILIPGNETHESLKNETGHLKTLAKMSSSQYRFEYKDVGGRMHVTPGPGLRCGCTEILCDHGWAARMVLQIITRDGQTVGVDIDLSALFVDKNSLVRNQPSVSDEESFVTTQGGTIKPETVDYVASQAIKEDSAMMREKVSEDLVDMLSKQLDSRTELLEETLGELLQERMMLKRDTQGAMHRPNKLRRQSMRESTDNESDDEVKSTIMPNDSSTQISRYDRRYMASGPVYTLRRGRSVLEPVNEVQSLKREFNVVKGFVKTASMQEAERLSNDKVYAINGLASPFTDSKLNFLMHFHTALSSCGMNPMDSPVDALEYIGTLHPQNPTEELMKQVIQRTFDFDDMSVIANPFSLPFIHVGMLITESCLMKCLTLLQNEYKQKWFESLKCLKVPSFHCEFEGFSTSVVNKSDPRKQVKRRSTRRGSTHDTQSSETDKQTSESRTTIRRSKGASLLGLRL
jgi:hypothetical protein